MLVKLTLGNVKVLNKEEVIKALQEGHKAPHLVLKPTWYAEHAIIAHLFSVPGWTIEDFETNDGVQGRSVFMRGNGDFSFELNFDATEEEEE